MTERPRDLIPGSGRRGASRALDSVVSVRFSAPLLADIRALAAEDGKSLSDWIRDTAATAAWERQRPPSVPGMVHVGWKCAHINMTSVAGALGKVTSYCGCEMQPVYANRAA
jgi:hypothetical protein